MKRFEEVLKEKANKVRLPEIDNTLWESIDKELDLDKKLRFSHLFQIAAAVAILVASGLIINYSLSRSRTNKPVNQSTYSLTSNSLKDDFRMDFQRELEPLKTLEIPISLKSNFKLLLDELKNLDKQIAHVDEESSIYLNNDILENQVIENYLRKRKILDRIEQEIMKIKKLDKYNDHESTKILLPF